MLGFIKGAFDVLLKRYETCSASSKFACVLWSPHLTSRLNLKMSENVYSLTCIIFWTLHLYAFISASLQCSRCVFCQIYSIAVIFMIVKTVMTIFWYTNSLVKSKNNFRFQNSKFVLFLIGTRWIKIKGRILNVRHMNYARITTVRMTDEVVCKSQKN